MAIEDAPLGVPRSRQRGYPPKGFWKTMEIWTCPVHHVHYCPEIRERNSVYAISCEICKVPCKPLMLIRKHRYTGEVEILERYPHFSVKPETEAEV